MEPISSYNPYLKTPFNTLKSLNKKDNNQVFLRISPLGMKRLAKPLRDDNMHSSNFDNHELKSLLLLLVNQKHS